MAKGVPALHQLLGLAKHVRPVLQFFAAGVHVGAHHHPAHLVALCRDRKHCYSGQRGTEATPPQACVALPPSPFTPALQGSSQPPPSLNTELMASKEVLKLQMAGKEAQVDILPFRGQRAEGERDLSRKKPSSISSLYIQGEHSTQFLPTICHNGEGS